VGVVTAALLLPVALVAGGLATTQAMWHDTVDVAGVQILAGDINLETVDWVWGQVNPVPTQTDPDPTGLPNDWDQLGTCATTTEADGLCPDDDTWPLDQFAVVPGDKLVIIHKVDVTLDGDNLAARLSVVWDTPRVTLPSGMTLTAEVGYIPVSGPNVGTFQALGDVVSYTATDNTARLTTVVTADAGDPTWAELVPGDADPRGLHEQYVVAPLTTTWAVRLVAEFAAPFCWADPLTTPPAGATCTLDNTSGLVNLLIDGYGVTLEQIRTGEGWVTR
jgi:hypothetical protein